MLKSENARPSGWIYVDVRDRDLASGVADLSQSCSCSLSGSYRLLQIQQHDDAKFG